MKAPSTSQYIMFYILICKVLEKRTMAENLKPGMTL